MISLFKVIPVCATLLASFGMPENAPVLFGPNKYDLRSETEATKLENWLSRQYPLKCGDRICNMEPITQKGYIAGRERTRCLVMMGYSHGSRRVRNFSLQMAIIDPHSPMPNIYQSEVFFETPRVRAPLGKERVWNLSVEAARPLAHVSTFRVFIESTNPEGVRTALSADFAITGAVTEVTAIRDGEMKTCEIQASF